MTALPEDERCSTDYESHLWDWIDGHHVCPDCGLIDLAGERIMHDIADRLEVPRNTLSRTRAPSP